MKKLEKRIVLLALLAVISVMINIVLLINKVLIPRIKEKEVLAKQEIKILSEEEIKVQEEEFIETLTEIDRIKRYVANYINYIQMKQYEKAYDKLNQNFKTNYFDTIEKYTDYITNLYGENIGVYYNDITRQGNYYILVTTVVDLKNEKVKREQRFVVYERDFNDYELSFEVVN